MLENVPSLDGFFAQSKLSAACVEVGEAVRARNFNKCRTSCWRMCRHLTGFLPKASWAPHVLKLVKQFGPASRRPHA